MCSRIRLSIIRFLIFLWISVTTWRRYATSCMWCRGRRELIVPSLSGFRRCTKIWNRRSRTLSLRRRKSAIVSTTPSRLWRRAGTTRGCPSVPIWPRARCCSKDARTTVSGLGRKWSIPAGSRFRRGFIATDWRRISYACRIVDAT